MSETEKNLGAEDATFASPAPSQLEANENEKPLRTDPNIVDFEGPDDPYNPLNWPTKKKIIVTMLYSFLTMGATWASTAYNSGIGQVRKHFDVNTETALAGMS